MVWGLALFSTLARADGLRPAELKRLGDLERIQPSRVFSIASESENALLKTPSRLIDPRSPSTDRLIRLLEATAREHHGAGIAAIQIGIPVRLILLQRRDAEGERFQPFFNPRIIHRSRKTAMSWEYCLSVPWGYRFTRRPVELAVRYQNLDGQNRSSLLKGEEALLFGHEMDHLGGILLSSGYSKKWFIPAHEIAHFIHEVSEQCRALSRRHCDHRMEKQWRERALKAH
jgi:peptide deformylase